MTLATFLQAGRALDSGDSAAARLSGRQASRGGPRSPINTGQADSSQLPTLQSCVLAEARPFESQPDSQAGPDYLPPSLPPSRSESQGQPAQLAAKLAGQARKDCFARSLLATQRSPLWNRTGHDVAKNDHIRTGQGRTGQDRAGQDKTGQTRQ